MIRGSWIPPVPLALGAFFGAASWLIVLIYGLEPTFAWELAWIHAVALGSFTTIALSVLIHVIPGFTDLRWRAEGIARWCAVITPFAALGLVGSFALENADGVWFFGLLAAATIVTYAGIAVATLMQRPEDRAEAAIARAMVSVLIFLAIAAALGALLANALRTGEGSVLRLAPVHASVALIGWLTLLTMGVSARTFRPILRSVSRWKALHIISNAAMLVCAVAAAAAFSLGSHTAIVASLALGLCAAILYAVDGLDRVARATTPHRPAHVFVASSLGWLIVASIAAVCGWYPLAIVLALSGWLGQMINAHLHHIGIRVIATTIAGDDNEARPWELLNMRVGWFTAVVDQCAVCALALGVAFAVPGAFVVGALLGLAGTGAFLLNVRIAIRKAPGLA